MDESEDINSNYLNSTHSQTINSNNIVYTPYPTLTQSQRMELNKILHTGALTNNNVSTFSDLDIIEGIDEQEQQEKQNENNGCCIIM